MIGSSVKVVKIAILGDEVIFEHLAIFVEVVAITINNNDFVFILSAVFVEVEVKTINVLSTSEGFTIFSKVIPVVVINFDKLVAFVSFRKNWC